MVDLMSANAMNDFVAPAVVAVHRTELSSNIVPHAVRVPGYILLRVMQEGDDDAVRGKDEVRYHVVHKQLHKALKQSQRKECYLGHLLARMRKIYDLHCSSEKT
jgi:hypothetical protein